MNPIRSWSGLAWSILIVALFAARGASGNPADAPSLDFASCCGRDSEQPRARVLAARGASQAAAARRRSPVARAPERRARAAAATGHAGRAGRPMGLYQSVWLDMDALCRQLYLRISRRRRRLHVCHYPAYGWRWVFAPGSSAGVHSRCGARSGRRDSPGTRIPGSGSASSTGLLRAPASGIAAEALVLRGAGQARRGGGRQTSYDFSSRLPQRLVQLANTTSREGHGDRGALVVGGAVVAEKTARAIPAPSIQRAAGGEPHRVRIARRHRGPVRRRAHLGRRRLIRVGAGPRAGGAEAERAAVVRAPGPEGAVGLQIASA